MMARGGSFAAFVLTFLGVSLVNMLKMVDILSGLGLKSRLMTSQNAITNSTTDGNSSNLVPDRHSQDSLSYLPMEDNIEHKETSLCTREEIIQGSWVHVEKLRPPYVPKNVHLRCYPEEAYTKEPWNTYQWETNSRTCELTEWNGADFCSLMNFGTVLIAGDSLSWEQYSSLGQLLGLRIHQSSQWESKENNRNHIQFGCRRKTRLVFRRDDVLTNLTGAINDAFPQVIVINRGAHYQNDTTLVAGIQRNIKEIKEWKEKCDGYGLKCHLFWRTSVPGQPLCNQINFTRPNNDLEAMEAWIGNHSNYDNHTINYHWYDYQHQNNLALDILREGLGEDGFEVLDAYYLNVLRPDEHRTHQGDCLHNCYPGKMDVYNQLLLHFLRAQRTKKDVDDLTHLFAQARGDVVATNGTQAQQMLRH